MLTRSTTVLAGLLFLLGAMSAQELPPSQGSVISSWVVTKFIPVGEANQEVTLNLERVVATAPELRMLLVPRALEGDHYVWREEVRITGQADLGPASAEQHPGGSQGDVLEVWSQTLSLSVGAAEYSPLLTCARILATEPEQRTAPGRGRVWTWQEALTVQGTIDLGSFALVTGADGSSQTIRLAPPVSQAPEPKVIDAEDDDFQTLVIESARPVLVDFWASWCGPCRRQGPIVESLAEAYQGRIRFVKVNTDEATATAERYGIQAIPTLKIFQGGSEVFTHTGLLSRRELEAALARVLEE